MAAGDLITTNYQYEFNGLLWGAKTKIKAKRVTGLLGAPGIRSTDQPRQGAWGEFPGLDLYTARTPAFDLYTDAAAGTETEALIDAVVEAFTIKEGIVLDQFVMQRPDGRGKRFLWARARRVDFDSMFETSMGLCLGSVELKAYDPRYYSLVEFTDAVTIANATLSHTTNITNNGKVSVAPVLEIHGPATNPVVANLADDNKQTKFTIVLAAGDVLVADARNHTVQLNGVDSFASLSADSQWWRLRPGVNAVTYSRNAAVAPATTNVKHRDAWIS